MQKQNVRSVRDHNRALILRQLHRRPGLSRSDIAGLVGLTAAAVSRITREMIDGGLIREGGEIAGAGRPGRRHVGLSIEPDGAAVMAACLTLFEKSLSVVNLAGEVVARRDLSDVVAMPPDRIPDAFTDAVRDLVSGRARVLGLGIVVAGALDHELGLTHSGSIAPLIGLPLRPMLEERLDIPVRSENLGNALNLAEAAEATSAAQGGTAMLVHVALGLGASLVIDGRPHRHRGDERLVGHIPVPGATGVCVCGAKGCLNTLVSGRGILALRAGKVEAADDGSRLLSEVITAAEAGDRALAVLFREAGLVLGRNLFAVSVAAAPDRITLAGPVPQVAAYVAGVRDGLAEAFGRTGATAPPVRVSRIGYARATEVFALEEFLLNTPLEMKRILALPAEPWQV